MEFYWEFSIQHVWCESLSFRLTTASKGEEGKNQILWFIVKFKCPIFHLSTDKHFGFSSLDLESPSGILSIFCQPRKKPISICCVPMCETFSVWSAKWLVRYTNKGWGVFSGRKLNGGLVNGKFPFTCTVLKRKPQHQLYAPSIFERWKFQFEPINGAGCKNFSILSVCRDSFNRKTWYTRLKFNV